MIRILGKHCNNLPVGIGSGTSSLITCTPWGPSILILVFHGWIRTLLRAFLRDLPGCLIYNRLFWASSRKIKVSIKCLKLSNRPKYSRPSGINSRNCDSLNNWCKINVFIKSWWLKLVSLNKYSFVSFAIRTVIAFTVFATFLTSVKTLTVFFETSSFLAIASFKCRSLGSKYNSCSHNELVDSFGSYLTVLLSILTAITITIFTQWALMNKKLPCAKHSQ